MKMGVSSTAERRDSGEEQTRLIERSRGGDAAAFSQLVALHQGRVRAYIGAYISGSMNRTDVVDDLAQEAFLAAFRSLESYKGDAPFGVWLLGIARHKALMHLRGEVRRLQRESRSIEGVLAPFLVATLEGDEDQLPRRDQEIAALQVCLENLPPGSAALIADRYFRSRSIADIARELGKGQGAIRMTLLRLRQVLRTCVRNRLRQEATG
jgi:RNA polymerase sigma-70 factor (ECF subfamily)